MTTIVYKAGMSAIVVTIAGCAQDPAVQPVNVVASDYCQIAGKIAWDVKDTPETIHGVRRENAKIDRRCKRPT